MTTADTNAPDVLISRPEDVRDELSPAEQRMAEAALQAARQGLRAPIDRALMRDPLTRPGSIAQSPFNVHDLLQIPPMWSNPGELTELDLYKELDGFACTAAVGALESLHNFVTTAIQFREAAREDPTLTPEAQALAVDDLMQTHWQNRLKQIDAAHDQLSKSIASLESELRAPVVEQSSNRYGAEIRSHAKSLSTQDRQKFCMQATNDGNLAVVGAVLGAPPFLSGLDQKMADVLLDHANRTRQPSVVRKLELFRTVQGKLEFAGTQLIAHYDRIVGSNQKVIAALRMKKNRAQVVISGLRP